MLRQGQFGVRNKEFPSELAMLDQSVRVLLVKGSVSDAQTLIQQLRAIRPELEIVHVAQLDQALECLDTQAFDVLLLDLLIPITNEFSDLWHACQMRFNIPIIGLTGTGNEVAATDALHREMDDHIVESWTNPKAVLRAVQYAVQQKRHEDALRESKERFRLALEASRSMVYDVDAVNGKPIFIGGLPLLLGYEPEQALSKDWWFAQIHPEDLLEVHRELQESRNRGNDFSLQYRIRERKGNYLIVEDKGRNIRDETGRVIRTVGSVVDITRRKQAEAALRESERQYHDLAEELELLVEHRTADLWNLNRSLEVITDCSKAIIRATTEEQLFNDICQIIIDVGGYQVAWVGLAQDEGAGTLNPIAYAGEREICIDPVQVTSGEDTAAVPAMRAIRNSKVSLGCAFLNGAKDPKASEGKNACDCHSSLALPLMIEGTTVGALTICGSIPGLFDQTQVQVLKELADDLSFGIAVLRTRKERDRAQRDLEKRSVQLRTLAAELSHAEERERKRLAQAIHDDLQQLLVGAKFCSDGLPDSIQKNTHQERLQKLNVFLTEAIESVRSLTFELSPPILHSAGLARSLSYLGRQMNGQYGLNVNVRISDEVEPELEDVRILLFQATRELLFNIVKHAQVKRADVEMRRFERDSVQVVVSDSGIGFDPAKIHDSSQDGFGLYSIRGRLELMGGHLEIESARGKGSRFTITAPLRKQSQADRNSWEMAPAIAAQSKPGGGLIRAGQKIRVLVADTHLMMRQRLVQSLQKHKDISVVGEAGDGRETLVLARQVHPDVIVLDVNMPLLNGVEITTRITQEFPQIKVVGLWAGKGMEKGDAMLKAGASAFLSKASRLEALITTIRNSFSGAA
jgi:PAS domain S-box-containing protein